MTERFIAIIPARAGSKGLPGKNKKLLAGKPLILHTVDAAIESKVFDSIIVSTDDEDIVKLICSNETVSVDIRPDKLASDKTEMYEVLEYLIDKFELTEGDCITLLQPTSPLRDYADIKMATKRFLGGESSALISVVETENTILKSCLINNDVLVGIHSNELLFKNRQFLPKTYKPNGAIYIYRVKDLLEKKGFHLDNTTPFIMNEEKSFDIDNIEDFKKIEGMLS